MGELTSNLCFKILYAPAQAQKNEVTLITIFKFINPLTPVLPVTARDKPWPYLHFQRDHFWPKLALSVLNWLLQKEKIFPMMFRSEWSAERSLRYAQKCSKSWVKNSEQNFLPLHLAAPWKKWRKKEGEKNSKNRKAWRRRSLSKFWFLRMPESQCGKTRCWWQERQVVVLETHFQPDQR